MKQLILFACLLLVAGPVYAEECDVEQVKNFNRDVAKRLDAVIQIIEHDRQCLARMERAARAIDKFVTYGFAPGRTEDMPERIKAIKLWDDVKKECWSK